MDFEQGVNKELAMWTTSICMSRMTMSTMEVGLLIRGGIPPTSSLAALSTAIGIPALNQGLKLQSFGTRFMPLVAFGLLRLLVIVTSTLRKTKSALLRALPVSTYGLPKPSGLFMNVTRVDACRYTRMERQDDTIIYNRYFDPQAYPQERIQIRYPMTYYADSGQRRPLRVLYYPEHARDKREVSNDPADWYAVDVANCESYIDAAFRLSRGNEAYLFMNNKYVLLDYAPGTTDDRVVNGPLLICDGYPCIPRGQSLENME